MTTSYPTLAGLTLPVKRTTVWRTLVQESLGGVETPQSPWTYPRYRWELPYSVLRQSTAYTEVQQLIGFYNSMAGRGVVFKYTDPNDSTSGTDQSVGTGDSTLKTFQLVRAYGSFVEPVFGVSTTSTAYTIKVGTTTISTAAYTVSNKGILTLSSAAPTSQDVAWNGSFSWYCRFDVDEYQFEQFTVSTSLGGPLWSIPYVRFSSVKFGA